MLTRLLERFNRSLTSAVQACVTATLSDDAVDRALRSIRSIEGTLAALKVKLASARAARRGHGDGGASTLKELGGMSEWQARRSVATAKTLGQMQEVQGAVEEGHISADNAARLARAARKTSPKAVESDDGLLAAAQRYAADDFDKAASRWEQAHQNDGGMGEHLRNRRRRFLQFWTQQGMVHFKGRTDLVSGTAIRRRLERLAQQLRQQDAKTAPTPGNGTGPQPGRLTFGQAMLDALDTTTDSNPANVTTANIADSNSANVATATDSNSVAVTTATDSNSATANIADSNSVAVTTATDSNPSNVNIADSNPTTANSADTNPATANSTTANSADTNPAAGNTANSNRVTTSDPNPGKLLQPTTKSEHDSNLLTARESEHNQTPSTEQPSVSPASRRSASGGQRSSGGVDSMGELGDQGGVGRRAGDGQGLLGSSRRSEGGWGSAGSTSRVLESGQGLVGGAGRMGGGDSGSGMPKAEIVVVMDLPALLGDDNARCEIPAVGPIPASITRKLAAVNGVVPILLDGDGEPLRHGGRKRLATREQWQALIARDGACIGCGADPLRCEAHHDPPFSKTGRTWIEELVLLCYECHHKVHDQNWQIVLENGHRNLRPPDTRTLNPRNKTKLPNTPKPVSTSTSDTYQPPLLC